MSSKIPQLSGHGQRTGAAVHFPADGRESPVGGGRPMSVASGTTQSSPSFHNDTRRKQNKRDEVNTSSYCSLAYMGGNDWCAHLFPFSQGDSEEN